MRSVDLDNFPSFSNGRIAEGDPTNVATRRGQSRARPLHDPRLSLFGGR